MLDVLFGCARIVAYDFATMDDAEKKRKQVARLYAGMSDEELEQLAGERLSLTEIGQDLLGAEMLRRGLDLPSVKVVDHDAPGKNLVMIRKFRDFPGALLAKGFLESAGVDSFLVDETTIRMDWLWSNALGGIKLCVKSEDVEAATRLLNQEIPEESGAEGFQNDDQPRCPQCQSRDISREDPGQPVASASPLIENVPVSSARGRCKCNSCGHDWLPSSTDSNQGN